jgi:hypothetical protein
MHVKQIETLMEAISTMPHGDDTTFYIDGVEHSLDGDVLVSLENDNTVRLSDIDARELSVCVTLTLPADYLIRLARTSNIFHNNIDTKP